MNLDDARQTFLAESRELLEVLEQGLLALEAAPDDQENVNALFRAAHTIKGSAGIFGYERLERFTHGVETVLDAMRSGGLKVNGDLVADLLAARDYMVLLVEVEATDRPLDVGEQNAGAVIAAHLAVHAAPDKAPVVAISQGSDASDSTAVWLLSMRFLPDVVKNGLDPVALVRYLNGIAHVEAVVVDDGGLPEAADYEPECCYLHVVMLLDGIGRRAIEEAFEFYREDAVISLCRPGDSACEDVISELSPACADRVRSLMQGHRPAIGPGETNDMPGAPAQGGVAQVKSLAAGPGGRSLRIDAAKLDSLINLVGELVIAGAGTHLIARRLADEALLEANSVIRRLVEEIRDTALRLRMVPIGDTFNRFHRIVRDSARELGKGIELVVQGGETELDKTMVEKIGDPLTHLVRNAMDHGIEPQEGRAAAGKPANGTVTLNAYHDSGSIVIEVGDDGRGIDEDRLLQKAIDAGLLAAGQQLSRKELLRLVFEPGLSTADKVTNLSGRGVGMDVVKRNIESMRGTVEIESERGRGTLVRIRLPLTLAIIDGFLVGVHGSSYVIPLDMVVECIEMADGDVLDDGGEYINLRGEVLPYLRLAEAFDTGEGSVRRENIVVVQYAGQKAGLVVDELLGEVQTVIKPLGRLFRNVRAVSGATILGSGEVAVILDVPQLIRVAAGGAEHPSSLAAA
jgi:two-component system chemotaxis sensor kinase CheA